MIGGGRLTMATSRQAAFRRYQHSQILFSRDVIGVALYPYQEGWADHIRSAVTEHRNETIVVEMPRQSGKNETSAHVETGILAEFGRKGGQVVKCAPTWKPQIVNSKMRLEERSAQASDRLRFLGFRNRYGYMRECGRASIAFLSAAPAASVVGATASLLMEVDEAQDVEKSKFDKDFSPMRASTGAPVVFYGTPWTDDTLLERAKQDVADGRVDGSIYRIAWEEVAAANPAYGVFVENEIRRLGREHPLIRTQYLLQQLATGGRPITVQHLRLMLGDHEAANRRTNQGQIVAGLDFAGADEDAGDLEALLRTASARDSVALTIGELHWMRIADGIEEPVIKILDRYEWLNIHPTALHSQLYEILWNRWRVDRVHCDATGLGETGTAFLQRAVNKPNRERVVGIKFDAAWTAQTRMASAYLAMIYGGRLKDYPAAGFDPIAVAGSEAAPRGDAVQQAWWQRGHVRLAGRPGKKFRLAVPDDEGHDDMLVSELLMVDAAYACGRPQSMQSGAVDWYDGLPVRVQAPEPARTDDEIDRLLSEATHGG